MLRLSSYFILSDRLNNGGYALLNGLSGAIEFLNEEMYQLLLRITLTGHPHQLYIDEKAIPDELVETYLKRGHLTQLSHEEERKLLIEKAALLHEAESSRPTVVIAPDIDCNYRCVYCFERPLQAGLKTRKTKMDREEVDAVYQAIGQLESSVGPTSGRIVLFGGEPLQMANKELVYYIVEQGCQKGLRFAAITNGHDLQEFLELLGEDKIDTLQITIDGPPHIHDKRRISLDGSSSFEKIIANMRRAIEETAVRITVRVNLDKENYPAFAELISIFARENWLNNERVLINAAIVYEKDASGAVSPLQDVDTMRTELLPLVHEYANVEIGSSQANQSDSVLSSLLLGQPFSLRSSYCAASCGMYVFLPDSKISCCWESLGEENAYIGTYSAYGLELDEDKTRYRFGRSAAKIPQCADCKYCLLCAGGCSQYAETNYHDIYKPHCDDFPQTYAWVLADAVENFLKANGL